MADTTVSKTVERKLVRVRLPLPAPNLDQVTQVWSWEPRASARLLSSMLPPPASMRRMVRRRPAASSASTRSAASTSGRGAAVFDSRTVGFPDEYRPACAGWRSTTSLASLVAATVGDM